MIAVVISYLFAYLLCGIPFGVIVGRLAGGVDIREHGSRNTGATNVFRVVGKGWGVFVLFLDAFKGYAAVMLTALLAGSAASFTVLLGAGVIAILGHSFSVWLKFRGGKGVATSLGVFLALLPYPTLATFALWILVFAFSRIISLSSLAAAAAFPLMVAFFVHREPYFWPALGVSFVLAAFIFYTHRANIVRLKRGEEKKLV